MRLAFFKILNHYLVMLRLLNMKINILLFALACILIKPAFAAEKVSFDPKAWKQVSYKKIKSNKVEFSNDNMSVVVDESASPLVYALPSPFKIKKIKVTAEISGINLDQIKENKKLIEDSPLRIGLVLEGPNKLNFFQRKLATDWVLELFKLAPKDSGLSHIEFYNVGWVNSQKGQSRAHPASKLIKETWPMTLDGIAANKDSLLVQTEFLIQADLHNTNTQALWVSIDGDDLKIKYKTKIREISYE
jgi:hypothetical protein